VFHPEKVIKGFAETTVYGARDSYLFFEGMAEGDGYKSADAFPGLVQTGLSFYGLKTPISSLLKPKGKLPSGLGLSNTQLTTFEPNNVVRTNWDRRPGWRKKTETDAIARATNDAGNIKCIKCDKTVTGQKQANGKRDFQIGHTDGNEWAKQRDLYDLEQAKGNTTPRATVIDNYQKNVEIECVPCNTSHGGKYGNARKTTTTTTSSSNGGG
jgi:hypothetical protein